MNIKNIFKKARDSGNIDVPELNELTRRFDCRKAIVALYLVAEKLITAEEAVESLEKENGFFLLSNQ